MYIQIEQTPNANALKFLVDDLYLESEFHYSNVPEESPEFIKKLFQLSEIERVYITSEFISISKKEHDLWEPLKPMIFQILLEAKMNPQTGFSENKNTEFNLENATEIEKQIIELLEERIKPAVNSDGGDISFERFDEETGVVFVKLKGSCSGCPSSTITLQNGIKRTLQHYIPEVSDVMPI